MSDVRYSLVQDRKGMMWDLLLYIPTVAALFTLAAKFWFENNESLAYLLVFLGSFFFIAGANRILKTRLMILPSAPVALEVDKQVANFVLRSGLRVELVRELRFYPDYAGRSFGLAGLDKSGQRVQFVFHKGQFASEREYQAVQDALRSHRLAS